MPALKILWYDGLKETPKVAGVPEGEWLGDPPTIQRADAQAGERASGHPRRRPRVAAQAGGPAA